MRTAAVCAVLAASCFVTGCARVSPTLAPAGSAADNGRIAPVAARPGTPEDLAALALPLYPGIDPHAAWVTRRDDARGRAITLVASTRDDFLRVVGWYANRLGRGYMMRRYEFGGSPMAAFTIGREGGNAGAVLWSRKDPKTGASTVQITLLSTSKS